MDLEQTMEYIYKKCSERIDTRIKEKGVKAYQIYPADPKLISRIRNNNRKNKNNKYLLTNSAMRTKDESGKPVGLIPILHFKNEHEILWGNELEFKKNLFMIFYYLIKDLLSSDFEADVKDTLYDYVPYAKYSAFFQIILEAEPLPGNIGLPFLSCYGVYEDEVFSNLEKAEDDAIEYLYLKCKDNFEQVFFDFTKETLSFTKINKVIEKNFINLVFIALLKKYLPGIDSLGLRVKNLIQADISHTRDLILLHHISPDTDNELSLIKNLIHASSKYICELENIQKELLSL